MHRIAALFVVAGLAPLLAACGSGGGGAGGSGTPTPISIDIPLDALNSGLTTGNGVISPATNYTPGDVGGNVEVRAHFTFQLGTIPSNATLTLATLRCSQTAVVGNPYGEIGTLDVDHIDQGLGFDIADHASAALTANFGSLSTDATLGVKVLIVTTQVQADRTAGRPDINLRLRFTSAPSVDGNPDQAVLGITNPGDELVLRVTYTLP